MCFRMGLNKLTCDVLRLLAMSIVALGTNGMIGADPCMLGNYTAHETSVHDEFIIEIKGTWQGKAIRTPIGPVTYDITYRQTPEGMVKGSADLIASVHHWTFLPGAEKLKLCFYLPLLETLNPCCLSLSRWMGMSIFLKPMIPVTSRFVLQSLIFL